MDRQRYEPCVCQADSLTAPGPPSVGDRSASASPGECYGVDQKHQEDDEPEEEDAGLPTAGEVGGTYEDDDGPDQEAPGGTARFSVRLPQDTGFEDLELSSRRGSSAS